MRYAITYEKKDDFDYPVLTLSGTLDEIAIDLAFFLSRHPELDKDNFVEYKRREL